MSLFCLPRGKLPLTFLAVPAGKDGRVECPRQTVNDFIGIRGSVCGLFLFVQTHAPLTVPPWQSRARKSKFQFHIRRKGADVFRPALAAGGSLMAYKCLSLCGLFSFFNGFGENLLHAGFQLIQIEGRSLHGKTENFLLFRVREIALIVLEHPLPCVFHHFSSCAQGFVDPHTHPPLSLLLRLLFLPEIGRNILLCGFQLERFFLGFLVLLVELCLFGCHCSILGFRLFRAGQLGDVVCLEIGCCRQVRCPFWLYGNLFRSMLYSKKILW